jgi:hypothetical protein
MSETRIDGNNVIQLKTNIDTAPMLTDLMEKVKSIQVSDNNTLAEATELQKEITVNKKAIIEQFKPIKEAAHKAHKDITAKEKAYLEPLEAAIMTLSARINTYLAEQRRIEAERKRAEEEARKKAEEEARLRAAEMAEANGNNAQVEDILNEAVPFVLPPTAATVQEMEKPKGLVEKTVYAISITDKKAFIKACLENPSYEDFIKVDEAAVKKFVASLKGKVAINGLTIQQEVSAHVRTN